jgi:hypothetical protein
MTGYTIYNLVLAALILPPIVWLRGAIDVTLCQVELTSHF